MFLIRYLDVFSNWQLIFCSNITDLFNAVHSINLDLCQLEIYSLNLLGEVGF